MHDNEIESMFRNRFENHRESIDADDMIERLNLNQSKKKRKAVIFWWIGILSVLFLVTTIFLLKTNKLAEIKERYAINSLDKQEKSGSSYENPIVENKKQNQKVVLKTQDATINSAQNLIEKEKETYIELITDTKRNNKDANDIKNIKQNYTSINSLYNTTKKSESINLVFNEEELSKEINNRVVFKANKSLQEGNDGDKSYLDIEFSSIESISLHTLDVMPIQLNINQEINIISNQKRKNNKTYNSIYFVEAYTGLSIANRKLTSSVKAYDEFVEQRNQKEKQLEAFQFGLTASKTVSKLFYISAGIEYSQINEKNIINFTTNNFTFDYDYPVHLQIQSNGDTIINNGTLILNTPSYHTLTEYNNHKLISVPFDIGIYGKIGKIHWMVDAGMSANLYIGFYGKMLDIQENIITSPEFFNTKIGFGYRTNIGLTYPLTQKLHLTTSLNFTNYLNSISDNNIMSQRYQLRGIRMGVQYQMN